MKPGGIADKLGNRYEARWTVYKLLQVVSAAANSIIVEGIDKKFVGFEFLLKSKTRDEWHQCKINAPNGNWTIGALDRQGILGAFKDRLTADRDCVCIFVSQDNARDLRDLSEEARQASGADEFKATLAKNKLEDFDEIQELLAVSSEVAFDFLKRIYVDFRSEASITEAISQLANHLIQTDADVFPVLRDYIETNLNRTLDTDSIRSWIVSRQDMQFKAWANPATLLGEIRAATDRYLDSYIPFGINGFAIHRTQTAEVVRCLDVNVATNLVLVTGSAGAGKSGVLRQVIDEYREKKLPVLAFRIDRYLDTPNARALGNQLVFREETPTSLLKGLSGQDRALLVIDQLDAVSDVSGREGRVKDAVFELVREAVLFGQIDLVIACRTFDFESDDRFRSLQRQIGITTSKVDVGQLDWESEILPVLNHINVESEAIKQEQRALLTSPVNLAVFAEIGDPSFSFRSRTELFARLSENKQRKLVKEGRSWTYFGALSKVADWMSEKQQLSAPKSILDNYDGSKDWLLSENILVESGGQVGFFHESYFDFIFARGFANTGKTVSELLLSSEQHLFRRTQVRQILAAMREDDLPKFRAQLVSLLDEGRIRFHVKLSVAQWFSSLANLSHEEIEIFLNLIENDQPFGPVVRHALFSTANTFPALNEIGFVTGELLTGREPRKRVVLHWLSNIAGDFPNEIASVLRGWWSGDPSKAEELVDWFGFIRRNKPDIALLALCKDVILTKPSNLFRDDGRDRIMMLMHSWVEHNPDMCGQIVETLFRVWFEMNSGKTLADDNGHPLLDQHSVGELSKRSPTAFVEGTSSAIERTIKEVAAAGREGSSWFKLSSRYKSDYRDGLEGLLEHFEACLGKIAENDPDKAKKLLESFPPDLHVRCVGFHLAAITANPQSLGHLLIELLAVDGILEAGWNGAEWKVFAECAKAVVLQRPEFQPAIEDFVFSIFPEFERAKRGLEIIRKEGESDWCNRKYVLYEMNQSGAKQYNILRTIGQSNLSAKGQTRLEELARKFPNWAIPEEQDNVARWVGSPISRNKCEKMNDSQWLKAIEKYADDYHRHYHSDSIDGGARQLAEELQKRTKEQPDRFLRLLHQIPLDANRQYFQGLLRGVAESEHADPSLIESALLYAVEHFGDDLDYYVLDVVHRQPELARIGSIQKILFDFARFGKDPTTSTSDTKISRDKILSVEDLVRSGERLIVRSSHGGRTAAWEALERSLWQVPEIIPDAWELVRERVTAEGLVTVRASIFQAMIPLFNDDKARYEDSLRALLDKSTVAGGQPDPIQILGTWDGVRMHRYLGFHFPKLTDELIQRMLMSSDSSLGLIGAWWHYCESFRQGRNQDKAYELSKESEQHRVLYAGLVANAYKWSEYRNLAEAHLYELFTDASPDVLKQAAKVFRGAAKEDFNPFMDLAKRFIETPAFLEGSFGLLHALEDARCDVSQLVVQAAERLLESVVARRDQHGNRGTSLHQMQDLLRREYASSENKPKIRARILDMIDFMLKNEIYGVDGLLKFEDR